MAEPELLPMERYEHFRDAYLDATLHAGRIDRIDADEVVRLAALLVDALAEELEFWQGVLRRWHDRRTP